MCCNTIGSKVKTRGIRNIRRWSRFHLWETYGEHSRRRKIYYLCYSTDTFLFSLAIKIITWARGVVSMRIARLRCNLAVCMNDIIQETRYRRSRSGRNVSYICNRLTINSYTKMKRFILHNFQRSDFKILFFLRATSIFLKASPTKSKQNRKAQMSIVAASSSWIDDYETNGESKHRDRRVGRLLVCELREDRSHVPRDRDSHPAYVIVIT